MRIAWVLPCRYLEVHDGLATIVGGGIDHVWVPEVPPTVPVQVLCATKIVSSLEELDEPGDASHELACRVHSPSMALISELKQPFGMHSEAPDATIDPAMIIPLGVVFEPQEAGQHTIEIAVDDRGISFPFNVVLAEGSSELA